MSTHGYSRLETVYRFTDCDASLIFIPYNGKFLRGKGGGLNVSSALVLQK